MPVDFLFPPAVGANQSVSLGADADFAAAYLGCIVKLAGFSLTLDADGTTDGFFVVCGPGTLVQGEDDYPLSANQAMFATYAAGAFFLVEQADVDLTAINAAIEAAKARVNHTGTQAIATITNLQGQLDSRSPLGHTHSMGDVEDLASALEEKAPFEHEHAMADVTGLAAAFTEAKARPNHTGFQAMSTVSGLAAAIAGRVALPIIGEAEPVDGIAGVAQVIAFSLELESSVVETAAPLGVTVYNNEGGEPVTLSVDLTVGMNLAAVNSAVIAALLASEQIAVFADVELLGGSGVIKLIRNVAAEDTDYFSVAITTAHPDVTFYRDSEYEVAGVAGSEGTAAETPGQCYIFGTRVWQTLTANPATWVELARANTVIGA